MDLKLINKYVDEIDGEYVNVTFEDVSDQLNIFKEVLNNFNDADMFTLIKYFLEVMSDVDFIEGGD